MYTVMIRDRLKKNLTSFNVNHYLVTHSFAVVTEQIKLWPGRLFLHNFSIVKI